MNRKWFNYLISSDSPC